MKNIDISKEDLSKIIEISNKLFVNKFFTEDDIEVESFSNGFVSTIYKVIFKSYFLTRNQHSGHSIEEPKAVVIKFYSNNEKAPYDILTAKINSIVISLAYTNRLGPNVYYVSDEAVVYEYLDSRDANNIDDSNEEFIKELADKLAKFHSLKVPIIKNDCIQRVHNLFDKWMKKIALNVQDKENSIRKRLERYNGKNILNSNYLKELNFVFERIINSNSPIVFTHGDFNHTNILMVKNKFNDFKEEIRLIDFDFSSYHFRGMDIGKFFSNCDQSHQFSADAVIGDDKMLRFIHYYIEANKVLAGEDYETNPLNNPKLILKEAKLFVLLSYLIDITFCLWYTDMIDEEKHEEFIKNADHRFIGFLKVKQRFIDENSI